MSRRTPFSALCLLAAALPTTGFAAGFSVDTQGGRASGLGTAVVADIDDPSAVFYNPAGLAKLHGIHLMAGVTLITPSLQFTSQSASTAPLLPQGVTTTSVFGVSPPPHVYATWGVTRSLTFGVGIFTNFGDALHWPPSWIGRFKAMSTSLTTFNVNPSVAYALGDRLRLGAGLQVVAGTVEVQRGLNFGADIARSDPSSGTEGVATIAGAATGLGFNAGLQVDVLKDMLTLGISYRSGVVLPFAGQATFDVPPEFRPLATNQSVTAPFRTPNLAMFGLAYRPLSPLLIEGDVHYFRWRVMREIDVSFADTPTLNMAIPKNWHDTFSWHLGAEYRLSRHLAVRLGFVFDPAPEPMLGQSTSFLPHSATSPSPTLTPDLPDSNRIKICVGAGYERDSWKIDAGYQYVVLRPISSIAPDYEGLYQGGAQVLGATFGYRF